MSYERAITDARARLERAVAPPWVNLEAAGRWSGAAPEVARVRRGLAVLASLAAAVVMAADAAISHSLGAPILAMLALPVLVLVLAAIAISRGAVMAQLFARASWWMYLVVGVMWSLAPAETLPAGGSLLAVCTGFALIASGGLGTARADARGAFDPVAFRGVILLVMVLAVAQSQLLLLVVGMRTEAGMPISLAPLSGLAIANIAAVAGLFRLRLWGVLALPLVAIASIVLAGTGSVTLGAGVRAVVIVLAAAQVLLPLPLLRALRRGAGPVARRQELPTRGPAIAVAVAMFAAIVAGLLGSSLPP